MATGPERAETPASNMSSSSSIGSLLESTPELEDALDQLRQSEDRFIRSFSIEQFARIGRSFIRNIRPEQLPILHDAADKFNTYKALEKAVEELKAAEVEFEREKQELERIQQQVEELKHRLAQPAPEQGSAPSRSTPANIAHRLFDPTFDQAVEGCTPKKEKTPKKRKSGSVPEEKATKKRNYSVSSAKEQTPTKRKGKSPELDLIGDSDRDSYQEDFRGV